MDESSISAHVDNSKKIARERRMFKIDMALKLGTKRPFGELIYGKLYGGAV